MTSREAEIAGEIAAEIARRFARFADAELIDLLRSGELTETAQAIGARLAELGRRGVEWLDVRPQIAPPVAPPLPATDWTPARVLWWLYFGLFTVALLVMIGLLARGEGAYSTQPNLAAHYVSSAIDVIAAVGLYGYIRRVRLLTEGFWQIVFTVYVGKLAIGIGFLIYSVWGLPAEWGRRPRGWAGLPVAPSGLGGAGFDLPLLWALFRYAFCSRAASPSAAARR